MGHQSPLLPLYAKYGLSAAIGFLAFGLFRMWSTIRNTPRTEPIRSPRWDIPSHLSQDELDHLPYPPDIFPGGRDVETPYGSIRVFEWGPQSGMKCLMVHGISTPAMALGQLAEELVERGCRVMLFDLFGRGYSDAPVDVPYDDCLYVSQILLAVSSSTLAWTGEHAFHLIGYSLGGGISMSFTRYLPHLVRSLTLIASSGLIRPYHVGWQSRFLYSEGLLPEFLLKYLVKCRIQPRLGQPAAGTPREAKEVDVAESWEAPNSESRKPRGNSDARGGDDYDFAILSKRYPHITIGSAVSWQIANHTGFIPAFMSTIRHGPIFNQEAAWATVGSRLSKQKSSPGDKLAAKQGLLNGKVFMILGATDSVVVEEEATEDAKAVLGEDNVTIIVLDAGHEVPITKSTEVAEIIWQFWTNKS